MKNIVSLGALKQIIGMIRVYKNWHILLLDYLRISYKRRRIVVLRNGLKLVVEDYDPESAATIKSTKLVANEVYIRKSYTPMGFEIEAGDTIVDIGAYIGVFSTYAALNGAKVYSYEPAPKDYKLLRENIKLNNLKNVETYKKAVCGNSGRAKLYLNEKMPQLDSMFGGNTGKSIMVECTTLKNIINLVGPIDLLKIDCEGAEYDIMFKTPKKYLKMIKKIAMEYHEDIVPYRKEDMVNFLELNGFDVRLKPINNHSGLIYAIRTE